MLNQRFKLGLLLISTISLISFGTYQFSSKKLGRNSQINVDSVQAISEFQTKINAYCSSRTSKNEAEAFLKRDQLLVKNGYESLYNKKVILEKDEHKRKLLVKQQKLVSGKVSKDSLSRAKYLKLKLEITLLDSLLFREKAALVTLQNDIKVNEQKMILQKQRFLKHKDSHDSLISVIRQSTSNFSGSLNFEICGVQYRIYVANLENEVVRLHLYKQEKQNFFRLQEVKKFLENKSIVPRMITNAGMFSPTYEPVGLYLEEGSKTTFSLNTSKKTTFENFYLYPNGIFCIDSNNLPFIVTTNEFVNLRAQGKLKIKMATQSGPMLLIKGQIHKKFTAGSVNAKIRSGVGKINGKKLVFAATTNGSNFYDFATFFKDIFGCKDALFLDGAISQMYLKDIDGEVDGNFGPIISVSDK